MSMQVNASLIELYSLMSQPNTINISIYSEEIFSNLKIKMW